MGTVATLKTVLNDLHDTLADMSANELKAFAAQWTLVKAYAEQPDAQHAPFYAKLIETVRQSPTLTEHRFPDVLIRSTRFPDEPAPNHNQPTSTQGLPPVHSEIVRIAQRMDELLAQSKPKA